MISETFNEELVAIEATAVTYLTAFTRADVAGVLATYADDGVLMGPGMPASVGKDELAKIYPSVFETVDFDMNHKINEVVQTSAEWAFVRSSTEGTETNKVNGVVSHSKYHELFLLRKSAAGVWQIARYCTSMVSSKAK
jgi:uncharacterized protein (TIGR02246 family)